VQPQHLSAEAVEGQRAAFESHPARLLTIDAFLLPERAGALARAVANDMEFDTKYALYSRPRSRVTNEEWLEAAESDRFFRYSIMEGIAPERQLSPDLLQYLQLRAAFNDPRMVEYFQALTGLRLAPPKDFSVHGMAEGDFLSEHDDDHADRQLAFVLYLTPDWEPRFGGTLRMVADSGEITHVTSDYNSIVMFDVAARSSHSVEPVLPEAGNRSRRSLGSWFLKPASK
jgi:Rps23 Pro-64 3,4-dihydroxylase Tpa1-like proline 4-hydroxylase